MFVCIVFLSTSTFIQNLFTSNKKTKQNKKTLKKNNNQILGYGRFKDYTTTGIKIINFLLKNIY